MQAGVHDAQPVRRRCFTHCSSRLTPAAIPARTSSSPARRRDGGPPPGGWSTPARWRRRVPCPDRRRSPAVRSPAAYCASYPARARPPLRADRRHPGRGLVRHGSPAGGRRRQEPVAGAGAVDPAPRSRSPRRRRRRAGSGLLVALAHRSSGGSAGAGRCSQRSSLGPAGDRGVAARPVSGRLSAVPATILDGKATRGRDPRPSCAERVAALAAAGQPPGPRHAARRRRPGQPLVRQRQAQGLRRGRHRQHPARPARPTRRRPRSRPSSTSSTPTRPAPRYLVQLPLPGSSTSTPCSSAMDPAKDADGLHPVNLGRLVLGVPGAAAVHARPASSSCCAATTCRSPAPTSSSSAAGITVGRPLGLLLTRRSENATVTLCHTGTRDLAAHVRRPTSSSPPPACPG